MMEIIKAIFSAEVLTILAIIVGPIAAVQVTRILDRANEEKARKLQIFKVLFSTRAQTLLWDHVAALNRIDLEFKNQGKEKAVIDAWKAYLDHLIAAPVTNDGLWLPKSQELLVDLLYEMGQVVGYSFDKTHIKNAVYAPRGYANTEEEERQLRHLTLEVLKGKRPIPVQDYTPQQDSSPLPPPSQFFSPSRK